MCVRRFPPPFFANVPFGTSPPFLFFRPLYSILSRVDQKRPILPPSIRLLSNDSQSRHCKIGKKKEGGGAPIFHSKKTCIASFPPPSFDKEHFWTPSPFPPFYRVSYSRYTSPFFLAGFLKYDAVNCYQTSCS